MKADARRPGRRWHRSTSRASAGGGSPALARRARAICRLIVGKTIEGEGGRGGALSSCRRLVRDAQLVLVFADEEAAGYALGKGWVAEALTAWKVRVLVVELGDKERERIRAAQVTQEMRNPEEVS